MANTNNPLFSYTTKVSSKAAQRSKPRNGRDADKPGAYAIATRIFSTVVDRGEILELEQYITGYGRIEGAKVIAYPSANIFMHEEIEISHGMEERAPGDFRWGATKIKRPLTSQFITVFLGARHNDWDRPTWFFDANYHGDSPDEQAAKYGVPIVASEMNSGNAPFHYRLPVNRKVKPGDYSLDFHFTYFNGDKWVYSKDTVKFKVRNVFEKYSLLIATLALVASVSGIVKLTLMPLYEWATSNQINSAKLLEPARLGTPTAPQGPARSATNPPSVQPSSPP